MFKSRQFHQTFNKAIKFIRIPFGKAAKGYFDIMETYGISGIEKERQ